MSQGQLAKVFGLLRRSLAADSGTVTDRELLERFAAGREEAAFTALAERHGPMVLAVCRRRLGDDHAAEDAFQATFLVLARKAAAVRWQESIGGWLHEVAVRVAQKAKVEAARRRLQERQVADVASPANTDLECRELRAVLDEELARLPDKYRAPLVLCYLEGKTNEEAAALLGWSKGTVSGQLARARDRLRQRLARRGVTLSAAMVAQALSEAAAPAAVPAALLQSTVQAALVWRAATTAPSALAAALAEGVLHAMYLAKLRMTLVILASLGLLGAGAGWFTYQALGHGQAGARATPVPTPAEPVAAAKLETLKTYAGKYTLLRLDAGKGDVIQDKVIRLLARDDQDLADFVRRVPPTLFAGPGQPELANPGAAIRQAAVDFRSQRVIAVVHEAGPPIIRSFEQRGEVARVVYAIMPDLSARPNSLGFFTAVLVKGTPNQVEFVEQLVSAPVQAGSLEFMAVADPRWTVPSKGRTTEVALGLCIRNHGNREVELPARHAVGIRLRPVGGKELPFLTTNRASGPFEPTLKIVGGASASDTIWRNAQLEWESDSTLRLSGTFGDDHWSIEGLRPGRHLLGFSYSGRGGAKTNSITIEIVQPAD